MPTTEATYQPAQVAALLGVNVGTVRRWTSAHAAHLSASAAPVAGGRRKLTPRDVEVLRAVRDLRDEGLSVDAINSRLAGLTFAVPDNAEPAQASPVAPGHELAAIVAQTDIATLLARVAAIERSQKEDTARYGLYMFVAGVGVASVFFLIIVLLYWLGA